MQYKLVSIVDVVLKTDESGVSSWVPNDPQNRDWQEYQAWLAIEGNVPEAAE